jgi:dienelactone hydrolase
MPEAPRDTSHLAGTELLTLEGDLAAAMVAGIDRFLDRETEAALARRAASWRRDLSSPAAYAASVAPNRERLRRAIGAVDARVPAPAIEADGPLPVVGTLDRPARVGRGAGGSGPSAFTVLAVRWPALPGIDGEGLMLLPDGEPAADVVALPDCDWTPEMLAGLEPGVPPAAQYARRLAESGCRVLVPLLIDRRDTYSGEPRVRMTNQPHREFLYRGAFEMGRHLIGYEVQKVLAAAEALRASARPVGVLGYGEGGLIALYAAAVAPDADGPLPIDAACVSGYFRSRQAVWREPIYRNVWGLLAEWGDAEIASLIAPRPLVIEACRGPEVAGPPPRRDGRSGAAPGELTTPELSEVEAEVSRARALTAGLDPAPVLELVASDGGRGLPGTEAALAAFLRALGVARPRKTPSGAPPVWEAPPIDPEPRFRRQLDQMAEHTQRLMREGEFSRARFWAGADASSVDRWRESTRPHREYLWDEVIGRFPPASLPANPRTRLVTDTPRYRGYEVMLDVWPDVVAYGVLLVPTDLSPGERRPVVVCQHGLEGRPRDLADPSVQNASYNQYGCRLAERGFVVYAPQNPYIGEDRFRVLQRKANPLRKSLFAVIVRQHERTLEWLSSLPFVDRERIAFYGLSYGGKTAMRVPALLEQYCLSICSADYNEWIWKNVSNRHGYSYLFTGEYEMFEFDLGNTFNYAELSWLICPRPFMVERGHHDGVAPDEWVAYEYAKTRRRYVLLGLADRTEIEFFDGPHTIHGQGTFAFLHRHLRWPAPPEMGESAGLVQGDRADTPHASR